MHDGREVRITHDGRGLEVLAMGRASGTGWDARQRRGRVASAFGTGRTEWQPQGNVVERRERKG